MNKQTTNLLYFLYKNEYSKEDIDNALKEYLAEPFVGDNPTKIYNLIKDAMQTTEMVPTEVIIANGTKLGFTEPQIMKILDYLENKGKIYKPRHHYYKPTTEVYKE